MGLIFTKVKIEFFVHKTTGRCYKYELGTRIATATGEKRSKYFLFQAISMAIQRGNVISILGTTPDTKKLDEVFYL